MDVPLRREVASWVARHRRPLASAAFGAAAILGLVVAAAVGTSVAARRAQTAREEAAEVAWSRAAARLEELEATGRAAEAEALFAATVSDPLLRDTRTLSLAWLAEADRRAAASRFDDAVSAVGQAWLASRPEVAGDVLVAMGDALAEAGRWEERTRVADLLERDDPARAQAPDGRRVVRDRDAWRRRTAKGGEEPLDRLLARLGRATRLAAWDEAELRFAQPPSLTEEPDLSWVVDASRARRVRGPGLTPDGLAMDLAAFSEAGGFERGPGSAMHPWWGPTRRLRLGDERLRNVRGTFEWAGPGGAVRQADPWWSPIGGEGGPAALLDVDGDGATEVAVSRGEWGARYTRVFDPVAGRTRAVLPLQSGALAVVRVEDRDWLAVAPSRHLQTAIQTPDRDPRQQGLQVYDVVDPSTPQWALHGFSDCGVDAVDLDADGRTDLIGGCQEGVVVVRQSAAGFEHTVLGGLWLDGWIDADGDGATDLVVTDEGGRRWLLGVGEDAVAPRPESSEVFDPDPSVQAALDLDRIGLGRDAVERLDAIAVMTVGTPVAARAQLLAAERSFGPAGQQRFLDLAASGLGGPDLAGRAARAQARDHRLPEAFAWARASSDVPAAQDWAEVATAPTLRWTFPGPLDGPFEVSGADLVRFGADGLSVDAADEREVLRLPVRVVDAELGFSIDATLDRLEWAGGWSASLETLDGASLGALRLRGTGGGRWVVAGLRCELRIEAQERTLAEPTPTPGSSGTFWWARTSSGTSTCGLGDDVSGKETTPTLPALPVDGWWVVRTHAESGTPRTQVRLGSIELRGMVLRDDPGPRPAAHPAVAIAALEDDGEVALAAEALRDWWRSGTATAGFVRTRPHWLSWLDTTAGDAALDSAWPQLYQHVGDPEVDSLLAQLGRTSDRSAPEERVVRHATLARALGTTEAARHHASIAWAAALGTADPPQRHRALTLALPAVLEQDLAHGQASLARQHLTEGLQASAWPELLELQLRSTPALRGSWWRTSE